MEGKKKSSGQCHFFFLNQKGNSRSVCCYIYLVCAIFFFIREKSGKFQESVKKFWIVMSVVSMLWAPDKRNLLSPPLLPGAKSYHYTSSFNLNMALKNTMNVRYSDPNLLNLVFNFWVHLTRSEACIFAIRHMYFEPTVGSVLRCLDDL